MTTNTVSTRRKFFATAGAAMSAPLALTVPGAAAADADGTLALRLAALEDQNAIRSLVRTYVLRVNAQAADELAALFVDTVPAQLESGVRSLTADPFDEHADVEIAADGTSAMLRMPCTVALEAPIDAPGCTLVDMAREQGEGVLTYTEQRVLEQTFVKHGDAWQIESSQLTRV